MRECRRIQGERRSSTDAKLRIVGGRRIVATATTTATAPGEQQRAGDRRARNLSPDPRNNFARRIRAGRT